MAVTHSGERFADDFHRASVRVLRLRRDRFVEFEFAMASDLAVELVMPIAEFERFCDEHQLCRLPGEAGIDASVDRLAMAHGVPVVPLTEPIS